MPTPNYGYEKRQKELARKQKKEEKLRARAERKATGEGEGGEPELSSEVPGQPVTLPVAPPGAA